MFDEKCLFPDGECDGLTPRPQFTTNEEIDRTAREMRETISRLIAFKKRVEKKVDEILRELTADNTIFKETFAKAHGDFTRDLKCEFNLFKATVDNSMILFREEYKDLADTCASQIREYFNDFCDQIANHRAEIGESVDEKVSTFEKQIDKTLEIYQYNLEKSIDQHLSDQDAEITEAVLYLKTNLYSYIESFINEKVNEGVIELTYKPELCASPEDFGAIGDGENDDTEYVQLAIDSAGTVTLHPDKIYRVTSTLNLHSNMVINGNGSTIEFTHTDSKICIDATSCENIHIFDLSIINHSRGFGIATNEGLGVYSVNITVDNVSYEPVNPAVCKGFFFGNVKDLTVENCKFRCEVNALPDEMSSAIIVWSEQDFDTNSKYINIRNNHIFGFYRGVDSYGTGTGSAGNRQVMTVEGNIIEKTQYEAIYCYHCPGSKIINNYILGCAKGIFADSSSDADIDGVIEHNMNTNLVSGNTINETTVGIYTEELRSGIISENHFYNCSVAGLIIGGGSNHVKVCNNNFDSCYDGVVLDMGYTANHYTIIMPEIIGNTFIETGRHCVFSKNCDSVLIKNNVFRLWGMDGDNYASAFRNEGSCGYKYIIGNEFTNRVVSTSDETKGTPYACISDVSEESYADIHICDNSFINALAEHDINIVNYSARRYFMNNRFDSTPAVTIKTGYENTYVHSNNNGIADNSK